MSDYSDHRAKELLLLTREVLKELPEVCSEFIRAIEFTTQPLTRYAYACDLKLFCEYLVAEIPKFADGQIALLEPEDFEKVTPRDLRTYLEYLGFYIKDGSEHSNAEAGKTRKLATLRSFYEYMFKSELIHTDVSRLVEMPKNTKNRSSAWKSTRSRGCSMRWKPVK